jgi:hypothetical protein
MLLTVELNREGECVEIFCDREGFEVLQRALDGLRRKGDHVHLMTPSWAGNELTEDKQIESNELVHHLRITMTPG